MKKIIHPLRQKTIFAFFILFAISKSLVAQQTEIKPDAPIVIETIILKFPDIRSSKVYAVLQTALAGTEGVSIKGRCPNGDYLFLNIDRRYYSKNDDVFQKITDANLVFELTTASVKNICSESEIVK